MAKVKGVLAILIGVLIAVMSFFTAHSAEEISSGKPGEAKKSAEDGTNDRISEAAQGAPDAIPDWTLEYPKRPAKPGERLPFPRPAIE